jgi:nicotinamidase-related amidase
VLVGKEYLAASLTAAPLNRKIMPLTKLDSTAALIVIDLQKGIAGLPTVHPVGEIIGRVARLAHAFRERGLPVVLVNVTGVAPGRTDAGVPNLSSFPANWTELVPELEPRPSDHLVSKQRWGALIGTSLDDDLRQRGVTQLFLTGVSTSAGVESTARSAYDYGYNVVFVADAMTDLDAEAHRHSVEKIFPRLGETDTTASVLTLLTGAPTRPA